uniref:Uncharacterized protein n=2 Tax=Kalmanozyma brasiliensis (strain GHG001) TaxID=1365824 RepID=V5EMW2_KALBG
MSGNTWSYDWNVPGYPSASNVIVAVSDSKGAVSGTSSLTRLSKAGSCSAPSEHLDFIWFPPASAPKQCDPWRITVQEDRGNLGLKMPVDLLIMPENDVPTRLRLTGKQSSVDWTANYARGTQFAIASFDAGSSGTGGVGGSIYTVAAGRSAACLNRAQSEAIAGLPAASSTAAARVAVSTSSAASRMTTLRIHTSTGTHIPKSTPTSGNTAANVNTTPEKSGTSTGVIGGAVGGVLGALAIGGLAFFFCKRQRKRGPDEYGVFAGGEKRTIFGGRSADPGMPGGRFGASTDQQGGISPFVTGRASPFDRFSRNAEMAQVPAGAGMERGHSSSISLHRGKGSLGGSALGHAASVQSVVPDEALFPPPLPRNMGWNRDRADSDPFRNPTNPYEAPLPPIPQHHVNLSPSSADFPLPPSHSAPRDLTSGYPAPPHSAGLTTQIPPVRTSFFDPYAHASRLYDDDSVRQIYPQPETSERVDTPTSTASGGPRYVDPKESAQRFRRLDDQLKGDRDKMGSRGAADDDDSDDEGLPYM